MPKATCEICGKQVDTTKGNYVFANGLHQHKKCPNIAIYTPAEAKQRRELTDGIKWAAVTYDKPLNWPLINNQIQNLLNQGFSFADQLYALKWLVEHDGTFWGYGRLEKFILHAMEQKQKEVIFKQKLHEIEKTQTIDKEALKERVMKSSKPEFI